MSLTGLAYLFVGIDPWRIMRKGFKDPSGAIPGEGHF